MPRSGHEYTVYIVERRVFLRGYYVVFREDKGGGWNRECGCSGVQECSKDTAVASIFGTGAVEGSVTFEDGDAEGKVWHFFVC